MPRDDVRTYEEGLAEPSGLKWSRQYIGWRGFQEAADALIASYRDRAQAVNEDRTRSAEWKQAQKDALQAEYRRQFEELVSAWEARFAAWEAEARKQGRVAPRSAAAEAAYTRALAEVAMVVPNVTTGALRQQFEAAVLRGVEGEVDGWVSALTALVKPEPIKLTRGYTPVEEIRRQNTTALLARVAEVAAARKPANLLLAEDNLAWLAFNKEQFQREREFLYANRMDLAPAPPKDEAARATAWVAEMTRPV